MLSILGKSLFYHWFNYFVPASHFFTEAYSGTEICYPDNIYKCLFENFSLLEKKKPK